MRNRWGTDVRRGFYVWGTGPRGGRVEGRVTSIDTRSDYAQAYGPRVLLDNGQSLGIDDVSQVLPPMTVADDFTVSQNPTPRLARADQPSQRERIGKNGKPTRRASERLKRRRALTHYAKTPGVWANPLTRVKVKSPSQRTKAAPDARLTKRRKVTAKAPPGFYANPVVMSEGPEYEIHVEAKKTSRGTWAPVAMFPRGEVGASMAKAYARALHGAHPTWAIRVVGPK